jgi:DNA-binding NtrC family response regulator
MHVTSYHILLIDSSLKLSHRVSELLKESFTSLKTTTVQTLQEAIQCLNENTFHGVLMEIDFQDRKGLLFLKTIIQSYPKIPVAVLTNQVSSLYKSACMDAGAFVFLDKSHDFLSIPVVVKEMLQKQ